MPDNLRLNNKKRSITISNIQFFSFLIFLLCMEPPVFQKAAYFNGIDKVFGVLKIGIIAIVIVSVFVKSKFSKKDIKNLLLLICIFLFQIVATIVNRGELISAINLSVTTITPCLWLILNKNSIESIMKVFKNYLYVLVFLNFLSIIIFPNGLIITKNMWNKTDPQWILSLGNSMAPYILATALFSLIALSEKKQLKSKIIDLVILMMCLLTAIFVDSATLIGSMLLFLILSIYKSISKKEKINTNINLYIIAVIIITIIIVVLRNLSIFSYFIVNILQRDLTLTSRLRIWDKSIEAIMQKPAIGYGFMNSQAVQSMLLASHQHNYYLHIMFQGGILSFSMFSLLLNQSRSVLSKLHTKKAAYLSICILCFLITFISESYGEGTYIIPFYMVIIYSIYAEKAEERNVFNSNALL